jgi:hypothetical protein
MIAKIDNPDHVTSAGIVVGIPSYNEKFYFPSDV